MHKESTKIVSARVPVQLKQAFYRRADEQGGASFVLKTLIEAYAAGRIDVKPSTHITIKEQ